MQAKIENVTPEMAKQFLLGSEAFQRNVSVATVDHYAKQMKAGEWQINGETIVISEHGQVIDGQHRLIALIKADVAVKMLVVYGIKQNCFMTIDSGKSRTAGNILHMANIKDANSVAACVTFRWKYLKAKSRNGSLNMWERPTISDITSYATNFGELITCAMRHAAKVRKSIRGISPSTLAGSYLIFCEYDSQSRCNEFFDLLTTGENMQKGHPVLTLRNKIVSCDVGSSRVKWQVKAAYLFLAYKKFMENKQLTILRWAEGSDSFPFF